MYIPTVGKPERGRDHHVAREDRGQDEGQRADEGVQGQAHRVLEQQAPFREALGARGGDVGLPELVEQVVAHGAHQPTGARQAGQEEGQRQMAEQVEHLIPVPGLVGIAGRDEPHGHEPEAGHREIGHDQRDQESRRAQAKEAEQRQQVVVDRVLVRGRVDAHRQRHDPRDEQTDRGDSQRDGHGLLEQLGGAAVVDRGLAQIAARDVAQPAPVADVKRLIQAPHLHQPVDLFLLHFDARGLQADHPSLDEIAGHDLHQAKHHEGDDEGHRQDARHPPGDVVQHGSVLLSLPAGERNSGNVAHSPVGQGTHDISSSPAMRL